MRRAIRITLLGAWLLVSVGVGAMILLSKPTERTELFLRTGPHMPMVYVYLARALDVYVVTDGTWGLGRDEVHLSFAGLTYDQSGYFVGRAFELDIPAWAWFSATFAAPAALLVWRWRRRKSAAARRGFPLKTDETTTASGGACA